MPRENGKVRSEYLLAALMCIAVAFFLTILIVSNSCSVDSPKEEGDSSSSADSSASSAPSSSSEATSSVESQPVVVQNVPLASPALVKEGLLVPVPEVEGSESGSSVFGGGLVNIYATNARTYASESEHPYGYSGVGLELREDALRALNAMVTAFHTTRGKTHLIVQRANINAVTSANEKAIEENLATGCSVLFSIFPADPDGDTLGSGKFLWLADNCTNYGYILRYPAEKSASTHENGNNSLFRYVGYEHAAQMGKLHQSLEEYLETIRVYTPESPLAVTYTDANGDERTCEVYYVSASGGSLNELPIRGGEGTDFSYTGNGSDGIIVTCYPG